MTKRLICIIIIMIIAAGMFCPLTVSAEQVPALSRELINLYPSQSYRLTVTDTRHDCVFSVADSSIAVIDNKGVVTAKSIGITEASCTLGTGEILSCTINVKQGVSPEGINLSQNNITLLAGEQAELEAAVIPAGENDYIFYQSSDEDVVQVDQSGNISAVSPGVAVITAETESTAVSASCIVRVLSDSGYNDFGAQVTGVLYDASGELMPNTPVEIKGRLTTEKLTTDSRGRFLFRSIGTGSYVLTVYTGLSDEESVSSDLIITSPDIRISCICTGSGLGILYGSGTDSGRMLRDIELVQNRAELNIGDTYNIAFTTLPSDAADTEILYSCSDTAIAEVDSEGRITALKDGMATVFVSSSDGRIIKRFTVVVLQGSIGKFEWALIQLQLLLIIIVIVLYFKLRNKGEIK